MQSEKFVVLPKLDYVWSGEVRELLKLNFAETCSWELTAQFKSVERKIFFFVKSNLETLKNSKNLQKQKLELQKFQTFQSFLKVEGKFS